MWLLVWLLVFGVKASSASFIGQSCFTTSTLPSGECALWQSGAYRTPPNLAVTLGGKRILFYGDSMVRQIFIRLVYMVREIQPVMDPWFHSDATYVLDSKNDTLFIGSDFIAPPSLQTFIGQFVWDPKFERYHEVNTSEWDLVVASPLYWVEHVGEKIFRMLAMGSNVVLVTTPPSPAGTADLDTVWLRCNSLIRSAYASLAVIPLDHYAKTFE